jgi:hypothetical protein
MSVTRMTVLHGTCLLKGKHPKNSNLWKECPDNPENAQRASESRKKGWATRRSTRALKSSPSGPEAASGPVPASDGGSS